MKRHAKSSLLSFGVVLAGFFLLCGCQKKTPEEETTEQEILKDPEAVACELKEVKFDSLKLDIRRPAYFLRRIQRENRKVYHGKVTIEQTDFDVLLPTDSDREFALYDSQTLERAMWWGSDRLGSRHKINGKFYEFAVTKTGKRFVAKPYQGDLGILRVGFGDREIQTAEFKGSLESKDSAVAVGEVKEEWPELAKECLIPTGDYRPDLLYVMYDKLRICVSNNYHSDLQGRGTSERLNVYGITIRKDKPFVFDFSNKPAVVFDAPKKEKNRFKVGDKIRFAAVLIDPQLDMMIRDLDDTSVKVQKERTDSAGNKHSYEVDKSLDPNVVIARANGEVVAEGVMPFG